MCIERHDLWVESQLHKRRNEKEFRKNLLATTIDTQTVVERKRKKENDKRILAKLIRDLKQKNDKLNEIIEVHELSEKSDSIIPSITEGEEEEYLESPLIIEAIEPSVDIEEEIPAVEGYPPTPEWISSLQDDNVEDSPQKEVPEEKPEQELVLPLIPQKKSKKKKMSRRKLKKRNQNENVILPPIIETPPPPIEVNDIVGPEPKEEKEIKVRPPKRKKKEKKQMHNNEVITLPIVPIIEEENAEEKGAEVVEPVEPEEPQYLEVDLGKPHMIQQLVLEVCLYVLR